MNKITLYGWESWFKGLAIGIIAGAGIEAVVLIWLI
jgi:hypothetical protein